MRRRDTYSRIAERLLPRLGRGAGGSTIIYNGGGGGSGDYLPLDGTGTMVGNLDMGGNDVTNVGLVDGADVSALAAQAHARLHDVLSTSDHEVTGDQYQVLGLPATDTLGLLDTTTDGSVDFNTILRSPASGGLLTVGALKTTAGLYAEQFRPLDTDGFVFLNDAGTQVMRLTDGGTLIKGIGITSVYAGADITGNTLIDGDLEVTGSIDVGTIIGDFVYTGSGTFRTPSLSFQDDDDLGIYRFDENRMAFTAAGDILAIFGPSSALLYDIVTTDIDANGPVAIGGDLTLDGLANQIIFQNGATLDGLSGQPVTLTGVDLKLSGADLYTNSQLIANSGGQLFGTGANVATLALAFATDTNTGLYNGAADTLNIAAGGVNQATIDTTAATFINTLIGAKVQASGFGSAAAPAFAFSTETDTGLYRVSESSLGITAGGTKVAEFDLTSIDFVPNLAGTSWSIAANGLVAFGPNADKSQALGRAIVGYAAGSDSASFAHYDHNSSPSLALAQLATGATRLNAASGQALSLGIAGSDVVSINDSYVLPAGNLQISLGDYNRKWSSIHGGEFIVDNLVASDVMATIGGRILVAPTTYLGDDFGHDSSQPSVTHNDLAVGDFVYMAAYIGGSPQVEWLRVHGGPTGSGPYIYTVERQAQASNTTTLLNSMTGVTTTMDLVGNQPTVGDIVQLADYDAGDLECVEVTAGPSAITGGYRYTVTRDVTSVNGFGLAWSAGEGVKLIAKDWVAGNALVSTGNAVGDGYIELTSTETLLSQYGPTISITSRTDADAWNGITEVAAFGNLRNRADYGSSDISGLLIANDTALTPATGLQGIAADAGNGVRLLNTDLSLYESSTIFLSIDTTDGIQIETNSIDSNDNRAISFMRSGTVRGFIKGHDYSSVSTLLMATEPISGLDTSVSIVAEADAAQVADALFYAIRDGSQSLVQCHQPTTDNDAYVRLQSTGQVQFIADKVLSLCDIDLNSNDLLNVANAGVGGVSAPDGLEIRATTTSSAKSVDNVRIGVISSNPVAIFENVGTIWGIGNIAGNFDIYEPGGGTPLSISSSDITIGSGVDLVGTLGANTNLSFGTGWTHYGGSYGNGQYKKFGDVVLLRGMVKRTSGSGATIATLPVGYRPPASYINAVQTDTGPSAVTISSTGTITLAAGGGTGWVSLNGVVIIL